MAWYTSHSLRYRGRLVSVESRYGSLHWAKVEKGKPLDLSEGSPDYNRLEKLFYRSKEIKLEIRRQCEFMFANDR